MLAISEPAGACCKWSRGSGAACVLSGGRKMRPVAAKPMHTSPCRPRQLLLQHVAPLAQLQCGGAAAEQPSWVVRASETTSAGSSGAPEGQVSAAIVEAMQVCHLTPVTSVQQCMHVCTSLPPCAGGRGALSASRCNMCFQAAPAFLLGSPEATTLRKASPAVS